MEYFLVIKELLYLSNQIFLSICRRICEKCRSSLYRKSGKNKCYSKKKTKNKKRIKKKGFIKFPCNKYPKSYALKHWQLGKSWSLQLNIISNYKFDTYY